jgi:hypothetical protein
LFQVVDPEKAALAEAEKKDAEEKAEKEQKAEQARKDKEKKEQVVPTFSWH